MATRRPASGSSRPRAEASMSELEALAAARPKVDFQIRLSDEVISRFHDEGYVTVARIAPDEELQWIGQLYDLLFADKTQAVQGGYFDLVRSYEAEGQDLLPQILAPEQAVPTLKE